MQDMEKRKREEDHPEVLPMDATTEIWFRLPAQSLSRFRFVSKSWSTSLTHPNFVYEHLNRSKQEKNNLKVLISEARDIVYGVCTLQPDQIDRIQPDGLQTKQLVHPVTNSDGRYVVVLGSCNGIICLIYPIIDKLCLWNPCTREFRMFDTSFSGNTRERWLYDVFGFGYSSAAKDYEIVRVGEAKNCEKNYSVAYVHSLAMNRCRTIQDIPYKFSDEKKSGQLINDALHWVACPSNMCTGVLRYEFVVAYDIGGEVFREVPQPMYGDGGVGKKSLTEFDGKLCMCCYYDIGRVDVWVMEEYGVKESWTKLFDVGYDTGRHVYCKPLCYTRNGCVLLFIQKDFVLYDPVSKTQSRIVLGDNKAAYDDGRTYTDSLVKLN